MGEKRGRREWQQWQKRGPRAYKREAEAGGASSPWALYKRSMSER